MAEGQPTTASAAGTGPRASSNPLAPWQTGVGVARGKYFSAPSKKDNRFAHAYDIAGVNALILNVTKIADVAVISTYDRRLVSDCHLPHSLVLSKPAPEAIMSDAKPALGECGVKFKCEMPMASVVAASTRRNCSYEYGTNGSSSAVMAFNHLNSATLTGD